MLPAMLGAAVVLALLLPASALALESRIVVGFEAGESTVEQVAALRASGVDDLSRAQLVASDIPQLDVASIAVDEDNLASVARELSERDDVAWVEVDHIARIAVADPLLLQMWGLSALGAPTAWATSRGAGVKVAVIDTGVDSMHPDLDGHVIAGPDYVDGDSNPDDEQGHGTHVAGVIAAVADNGIGGAGIAPDASVVAIRALDAEGAGYHSWIASGVVWSADNGVKVINLSLGSSEPSIVLEDAIAYAAARGVLVTCASGNDAASVLSYPARYEGCTSVGAVDEIDLRADFSDYGEGLDLVAPGVGVLSTVPGGYERMDGTSMASPHVAGAAALLYAQGLRRGQVLDALKTTAVDIEVTGYDVGTGYGRISAAAAVAHGASLPKVGADASPPLIGSIDAGTAQSLGKVVTASKWKRIRMSKWRKVGVTFFDGDTAWKERKRLGPRKRKITWFRVRRGNVQRRVEIQRRVTTKRTTGRVIVPITVSASDDVAVDRVGVSIDGHWAETDTDGRNGWTIAWTCSGGSHRVMAYAFDAADNMATSETTVSVRC
jgi:thermitase